MTQFHSHELTIIEAMERIYQECKTFMLSIDLAKEYLQVYGLDETKKKIQAIQEQEEAFARFFAMVGNPSMPRRRDMLKNRDKIFCSGLDLLATYKKLLTAEADAEKWQSYSQQRLQKAKEKFSDMPPIVERYQSLLASSDALVEELQKNIDFCQQQGFKPESQAA